MATQTEFLNLTKPSPDDYAEISVINANFDLIDENSEEVNNTITQHTQSIANNESRITVLENKEYPYLPITGGNITGDLDVSGNITIKKHPIYALIETLEETTDKYTQIVKKYSDGTQIINIHTNVLGGGTLQVNFLSPFIDDSTTGTYALDHSGDVVGNYDWFWPIQITQTFTRFNNSSTKGVAYTSIVLTGKWK